MQISTFNKKNKKWLFIGMFTTFGEFYNLYNINFYSSSAWLLFSLFTRNQKSSEQKKKSK